MGATAKVADFLVETGFEGVPQEAVEVAKDAVLDYLGVTLAGSKEAASRIVSDYVKGLGGRPEAGVIGWGFKTSAPEAALANGTQGHILDYDDVALSWIAHPTVAILPAVLALGEEKKASGREVLLAYILGFEVGAKLGAALGLSHYANGWHNTSTLGTMGAAAAASKILKLTLHETRMALGIAASQAGGLRQNFGTMTKPLHAGTAARNGVVAALLAQRGFTADEGILENPLGFCQVMGRGQFDLAKMTERLGQPFDILSPGLSLKLYPCCRGAHRYLDALLKLIAEHDLVPEEVSEVECQASDLLPRVLIHSQPRTALEGKFSLEFCMAIALRDRAAGLRQFTEEKVLNPRTHELMGRVKYHHPEELKGAQGLDHPIRVTVRLSDGREYSQEVRWARGDPQNPLTRKELVSKYREGAGFALPPERVERCLELVSNLEALEDISQLMALVT